MYNPALQFTPAAGCFHHHHWLRPNLINYPQYSKLGSSTLKNFNNLAEVPNLLIPGLVAGALELYYLDEKFFLHFAQAESGRGFGNAGEMI
jgi:hypothetical protein